MMPDVFAPRKGKGKKKDPRPLSPRIHGPSMPEQNVHYGSSAGRAATRDPHPRGFGK